MTRRLIALALAWSLLAAPATAHELVVTHVEHDLARATERLARLTQPTPATMLSDVEVHQHFERALSDHLVGEHTRAAERFYALEPYVRDASLRQEVQWYRAETLLAADLPNLAEQALDSILADPTHQASMSSPTNAPPNGFGPFRSRVPASSTGSSPSTWRSRSVSSTSTGAIAPALRSNVWCCDFCMRITIPIRESSRIYQGDYG